MAIHTAGYYWVVQEPVFWTDRHWTLIGPQMVPANLHELFPLEKTFTILDTHSEFD
ncbi:hypothetical protein LG301_10235 [Vreelandella venusta]|uniref:hypothetical protein n=1 Tax=Vreelandella venusta TaxID=44935 RepID=UPI003850DA56